MKTEVFFKLFGGHGFHVSSTALAFKLFGNDISIQWYGVIIAFGFLPAVLFGGRMAYKWKMNLDKMIDVLIGGTIGGVFGARIYYILFHWSSYKGNFADVFRIWEGGMAIYGGLIGGLVGAFIVCKIRKVNFLNLLDLAAMGFLIGQGIGRWGNFTNQEAFGVNTNLPWGMWSQKTADYIMMNQAEFASRNIPQVVAGTFADKAYVHPTFLYESLWCLLSFGMLYLICRNWRRFSGQLILCYGVLYGAERFVVEGLRLDSLYIGSSSVRASQLLSGVLAIGCLALLVYLTLKYRKNPKPIEGIDYFPSEASPAPGKSAQEDDMISEIEAAEEEEEEEEAPEEEEVTDGADT